MGEHCNKGRSTKNKKKKNNNQSGSRKKGFWNECDKKKYSGDVAIKI